MADPKVVHPPAQNWIDFRNHSLDGPADMLAEDLPELFKQRCPLLQLGRIVGAATSAEDSVHADIQNPGR